MVAICRRYKDILMLLEIIQRELRAWSYQRTDKDQEKRQGRWVIARSDAIVCSSNIVYTLKRRYHGVCKDFWKKKKKKRRQQQINKILSIYKLFLGDISITRLTFSVVSWDFRCKHDIPPTLIFSCFFQYKSGIFLPLYWHAHWRNEKNSLDSILIDWFLFSLDSLDMVSKIRFKFWLPLVDVFSSNLKWRCEESNFNLQNSEKILW